jgi:CubicO group peptidase (beta-lactamase class C family)
MLAQPFREVSPESIGMDSQRLNLVDNIIKEAISDEKIPGAVLLVMRDDKIAYKKAFGYRQLLPKKEVMQANTVFDLASLTKPIATATSIMILLERGKLRLLDNVEEYIPGFESWYEDENTEYPIRIVHLLTHTSGLPAYAKLKMLQETYGEPSSDSLMKHISSVERGFKPGTDFKYSCLNFISLQRIVENISGQTLRDFTQKNIFNPLGMKHTDFNPEPALGMVCATTEILDNQTVLKGTVHDPLARVMMLGISGNAGLFSNVADLAIFSSMLLNDGIFNGIRILSPAGVRALTTIPVGFESAGRGLGWDLNSSYASNQGDLFGENAYGHTGYTGTSLVIDPEIQTVVIFLTNRVHPYDKGSVVRLRSLISNIVVGSIVN